MNGFINKTVVILGLMFLTLAGCATYGTRISFGNSTMYYTDNATREEAMKLGEYLVSEGIFKGKAASAQLDKSGGVYLVKMPVKEVNVLVELFGTALKSSISKNVFHNQKVELHLTDQYNKTLKVIK